MDVVEYAKSINWAADYMDMDSGYIFKISEAELYNYEKIPVTEGGMLIGFVNVPEDKRPKVERS